MFNQVRLFEGQPVRVWSQDRGGRFVIFPSGLMRWLPVEQVAALPRALFDLDPSAFPAQDPRPQELM